MPNSSVTYNKYENTNLSNPPITQYLLNGPNIISYNDPVLASNGYIANNTDWEQFQFQTIDSNNIAIDTFKVGVFRSNCDRKTFSTHYGTYSTAEWVIHPTYHEVNIY
ncbi:hypothetical protein [Chryseobacterium taiwanense]|uniref:Uncharacterized protein n=1 Tax=Chryseobacterium taiwanense TaxID=363331 RepID=A0A0B4ECH9_9FLAO|nr:hypothetical protein [Chryseobacterium taiwanense]KIC64288.1 hypothetical protein RM51_06150 [Chryseobacterium taiwanense]